MGDEKLIDYAKNIYKQHKKLLDFVYRYGVGNDFKEACELFKNSEHYVKEIYSSDYVFSFIPHSIERLVGPLLDAKRIKLGNSYGKEYPIHFWFEKPRNEDCVRLIIEIGPFSDLELREKFKKLIFSSLGIKSDVKKSTTFTRIYSRKTSLEDTSASRMQECMHNLFHAEGVQKIINDISNIDFTKLIEDPIIDLN